MGTTNNQKAQTPVEKTEGMEVVDTTAGKSNYISLEDVLGRDTTDLTELKKAEFETEKIGVIPYTALDYEEYKIAKKACMTMEPDGTGGMQPKIDDDKLMLRVVQAAVDKDTRSSFTFFDKQLLKKMDVTTADQVVGKLLQPGEVLNFAMEVQNLSGFGKKKQKEQREAVKN